MQRLSFLNCELSTNSCVRYSGSAITLVTINHVPSSGSLKLSHAGAPRH
jgi:hypothetical protein